MQVGDKVWIFDSNRRVYEDDKGNRTSSPWYRGYFVERYIIGETKQSWIVGYEKNDIDARSNFKVNKKTLKFTNSYGAMCSLYASENEVDEECWIHDNHYSISEKIRFCKDYNKLKRIEEILNS